MFFWPSAREGLAWLEASDETWAGYADAKYAAAAERDQDDPERQSYVE